MSQQSSQWSPKAPSPDGRSSDRSRSYPDAYCVKCGQHTHTLGKHTVVLSNQSRALRGVCPACESEVYKILPKIRAAAANGVSLSKAEKSKYPDAFCVKCQSHKPTLNARTVILDNNSRAVTGSCQDCGSEVYRILGKKVDAGERGERGERVVKIHAAPAVHSRRIPLSRQAEAAAPWALLAAAGLITGIVLAFLVYTVM